MANIDRITRTAPMPRQISGPPQGCTCDGCRFPSGQYIDVASGRGLDFGYMDPDAEARLAALYPGPPAGVAQRAFMEHIAAADGQASVEPVVLKGYGSCRNERVALMVGVDFHLTDGRHGVINVDPAATDDQIKAAISAWAQDHPLATDGLVGATI